MATAMRTVAAKLKQKFPVAVQRPFPSSQAPVTSTKPCGCSAGPLEDMPEFQSRLEKIIKKHRRNDYVCVVVGTSLGCLIFLLGVEQLKSKKG
ncbi:unnamed protein product [Alopecurus aequalis]